MAVCAGGNPTPWREYSPCPLPAGTQTAPHPGCPDARGGLAVRPGSRSGQRGRYVSNRKPPTVDVMAWWRVSVIAQWRCRRGQVSAVVRRSSR